MSQIKIEPQVGSMRLIATPFNITTTLAEVCEAKTLTYFVSYFDGVLHRDVGHTLETFSDSLMANELSYVELRRLLLFVYDCYDIDIVGVMPSISRLLVPEKDKIDEAVVKIDLVDSSYFLVYADIDAGKLLTVFSRYDAVVKLVNSSESA